MTKKQPTPSVMTGMPREAQQRGLTKVGSTTVSAIVYTIVYRPFRDWTLYFILQS